MSKNSCQAVHSGQAAFLLLVFAAWIGVGAGKPLVAGAEERTVLCEEFTNKLCASCAYAGPALDRLLEVYSDSFAFVQYHVSDEYATPCGDARWVYHDGVYTPTAVFDGIDPVVGAVSDYDQQYNIYRTNHFLPQRAIPTDVTLDLIVEHVSGQDYRAIASVGVEAGGAAKTLRVYLVQVLDHWPAVPAYSRNTFKQAAPTVDVSLAPGGSQSVDYLFTFDADSWANQENIKIIAWAQDPADNAPGAVHQSATRVWPLVSGPNDADGDLILDTTDNCPERYNPTQDDGDGDGVGDACDNCPAVPTPDQTDTDEDGYGDACDTCVVLHHYNQEDLDGDGLGDVCDSCPEVPAPGGIDPLGRALGTIDLDCDVDRFDVVLFSRCTGGPGVTAPPSGCTADDFARSDLDSDGDVDMNDLPVFVLNLTGPLLSPPIYIGAGECVDCHGDIHSDWLGTIHATAFDTLAAGGNGDNELCFPCHAVGYGAPSGFVDLATTPYLANVQCEDCHGPGSNHAGDPRDVPLEINLDSSLCGACHQSCHGLCGEDHHPQFEQWSTSKHSTALEDIRYEPDFQDSCLQCHSTDYRLAFPGEEPTAAEAVYDLECAACHRAHGSPNVGQLRLAPRLLCADCHTAGGLTPGEEPRQPQVEMLHGTGGFALDGAPLDGPYSAHWWGIPDECAVCHVHEEPYGGPTQPVNSGHTFKANLRACAPCHNEATATELVTIAREEFEARFAEIARYLDPADPRYVDPAALAPEDLAPYRVALFNYEFVQADKSFAAHNPGYARALLAETELFFGITPWKLRFPRHGEFAPDIRPLADPNRSEVAR